MSVEKTTLENGLTIATDTIRNFETVSVGVFVNVGSVNETQELCGVSHFVEHMAFKGTSKRTAIEISSAIESVGGHINAYTSKEITAYYAKVLKENTELAVDIISDIIQNSIFDPVEFEKEREVITQEIKQTNDTPDDLAFDVFQEKCFDGEALGRPILGFIDNIKSFKPSDLDNYLKTNYCSSKMILAASGNIEHNDLVHLAQQYTPKISDFPTKTPNIQSYKGGFAFKEKDLEQRHILIGFKGAAHKDIDRFDLCVLSTLMGGGMSSRLFQEIREKRGLAYSIFSYVSSYRDSGMFGVYTGCDLTKSQEVVKVIYDELQSARHNISSDEVEKAKIQMKAALLMGLESSSTRMERTAHQFLLHGRFFSSEEITSAIDKVSVDSVIAVLNKVLLSPPTLAVVGRGTDVESLYKILQ